MIKKERPLISVIVPVYMVSGYLDRCIKSIVNQKYRNLEILLVDDGSHDDCSNKCDEWAKKDDRIMTIHKLNGGQSETRNYGMKIACGEFVSFIDSDDYASNDFLDVLLNTALEYSSEITVCDYSKLYENGKLEEYQNDLTVSLFSTTEGLSALIAENPFYLHVWDKLYKRKVIQDIQFDVGKIHEDVFWLYRAFGSAERIAKINRTLYFYLQRGSSTTGQGFSLNSLDYLEEKWNGHLYVEKNLPELALQSKLVFFGSCMYMMQCALKCMTGNEKRQAVARIRNYKKMCGLTLRDIKSVGDRAKKYYYLAKLNLYLCCRFRLLLGIH